MTQKDLETEKDFLPEKEFLTDDLNRLSAVRLMALISLLSGILLGFLAVLLHSDQGCWLAVTLVGAAFTGKVAQKQIEKPNSNGS